MDKASPFLKGFARIPPLDRDPLKMAMDICFVPSLQHLASSKIVASLFNKVLQITDVSSLCGPPLVKGKHLKLRKSRYMKYREIKKRIKKEIRKLIPCASLQKRLKNFISPLYCEIKEWLKTCRSLSLVKYDTLLVIMDNIPHFWLTDGTIDLEKSAKSVVENSDILIDRFIFACTYCLYEDVLILWELLSETEKDELRSDSDFVVKEWIAWLESWLNKDWQFCVAWILGTPLWNKNISVLKRVLGALTPSERTHYLRKVLIGREMSCDVMRFGLSLMTRDEQELILKESPVEVFKCITCWPVRSSIFDTVDIL
ncbi:hypothetical protein AVEN_141147-1 [Araneus ventricosus]|uniref:Uncharacterized protein n=1 Tax=Araneus ventricosus TaxID=182803 RepID=A0A4Y2FK31_ARAVE|nr:hypothetical protein AVEN_141147-1 [Araneus ventricosus]